jgi:hypothetical protein
MHDSCRRHRPDDETCPPVVHDLEDAISVLYALSMTYPEALEFALVMDGDRRGQMAIPIEGERPPGGSIETLAGILAMAFGDHTKERVTVILGSKRPSTGFTTDDARCWQRLREQSRAASFELLDWILVAEDDSRSMSETCGPGWPAAP